MGQVNCYPIWSPWNIRIPSQLCMRLIWGWKLSSPNRVFLSFWLSVVVLFQWSFGYIRWASSTPVYVSQRLKSSWREILHCYYKPDFFHLKGGRGGCGTHNLLVLVITSLLPKKKKKEPEKKSVHQICKSKLESSGSGILPSY